MFKFGRNAAGNYAAILGRHGYVRYFTGTRAENLERWKGLPEFVSIVRSRLEVERQGASCCKIAFVSQLSYRSSVTLHEVFRPSSCDVHLADSDGARATGQLGAVRKSLSDKEHVLLKVAHAVSLASPEVEVVTSVDAATDRAGLLLSLAPHGEILGEGSRSLNGRLVHALSSVESIVVALRCEVAAQSPWLTRGENIP